MKEKEREQEGEGEKKKRKKEKKYNAICITQERQTVDSSDREDSTLELFAEG